MVTLPVALPGSDPIREIGSILRVSGGRGGATPQAAQTIQRVQLTQAHQIFTIASDVEPTSVTLDPNAWVMMRADLQRK